MEPETSEAIVDSVVDSGIANEPAAEIGSRRDDIIKAMDAKEQASETPEQKATRERDDKGKFKPKADLTATEKPVVTEQPKRAYPKSWTRGLEPKYETLDPDVVSQIEKRESDIENGFKRIEQIKQQHDEIQQVIMPYLPTLNSLGKKPAEAIKELLNADYTLRNAAPNEKKAYFDRLAKNYGIDLGTANQQPEPIAKLQDHIFQLETQLRNFQQQSQNANLSPYINEIEAFKADPAHTQFEEVRTIMSEFIRTGKASDLKTAYDMSLRSLSDPIDLDQERKKWAEEERARIEKAKQAAVSVKGAPASKQPSNQIHDRRAAIEAAIDARSR